MAVSPMSRRQFSLDYHPTASGCGVLSVNGERFILVYSGFSSGGRIQMKFPDETVIFLKSLQAKDEIDIEAGTVIAFGEFISHTKKVKITSQGRIFCLGAKFASELGSEIRAKGDIDLLPIGANRRQKILELFRVGTGGQSCQLCFQALLYTADAICTPPLVEQQTNASGETMLTYQHADGLEDLSKALEFVRNPMNCSLEEDVIGTSDFIEWQLDANGEEILVLTCECADDLPESVGNPMSCFLEDNDLSSV